MRFLTLLSVLALSLTLSCFYDIHDGDSFAFEEAQSVWQYLSVFSIHQDRVPKSANNLTPEQMFDLIDDRLHGYRYTTYITEGPGTPGLPPGEFIDTPVVVMPGTVYFHIPDFSYESLQSFQRFTIYLSEFDNIIIDLRYNGGGLVSAAEDMLGEFLPRGTEYLEITRRSYDSNTRRGYTVTGLRSRTQDRHTPALLGKNIVVLMNGSSASSSEIMISGIKDGAVSPVRLLGSRTYGKGMGQVLPYRPGKRSLLITSMFIAGLPGGYAGEYNGVGIEPDELPAEVRQEAAEEAAAGWSNLAPAERDSATLEAYRGTLREAHNGYNSLVLDTWMNMLRRNSVINVPALRSMLKTELTELYCALMSIDSDYEPPTPQETVVTEKAATRAIRPARLNKTVLQVLEGNYRPIGAIEIVDELPGE